MIRQHVTKMADHRILTNTMSVEQTRTVGDRLAAFVMSGADVCHKYTYLELLRVGVFILSPNMYFEI